MTSSSPLPAVDLWICHLDECLTTASLKAYEALLSPAELSRAQRFHFQRDRDRHVVSRALLRTVLAPLVGDRPDALQFATGPHGKPFVRHDSEVGHRLSFSLSHTDDLIVLGVTMDHALGVDVESTRRAAPLDVVQRHFAEVEVRAFHSPDPPLPPTDLFWSCWTLKESLIKATGEGLHAPLDRFGFGFEPSERIVLHASPDTAEGAQPWWMGQWAPTEHHLAAVCVAWPHADEPTAAGVTRPELRGHRVVPLQGAVDVTIPVLRSTTGACPR